MYGFDENPCTSFTNKGTLTMGIEKDVKSYTLLLKSVSYTHLLLSALRHPIGHDPISYAYKRTYDHHGQEDI